jgi:hypothetical protein
MPKTSLWTILFLLVWSAGALAQTSMKGRAFWEKSSFVGASLGFIGRGEFRLPDRRYETDPGFTYGVRFDFRLHNMIYWGVSADVHRLHIRDTGQYMLDLNLNLKKMYFGRSSQVGFRPGIGLGFAHLANFREVKATTYFTCRTTFEVIFFSESKAAWLLEVGLMAAPVGGNRNMSISYGPVPLARIGALL